MIKEFLIILIIVAGVVFLLKILGKFLKFSSYVLVIAILSLLIISFVKPDIKNIFIDKIKENTNKNFFLLKQKITGSMISKLNIPNKEKANETEEAKVS